MSGFESMLAAWIDGEPATGGVRQGTLEVRQAALWGAQPRAEDRPAFDGGILAISPALNIIDLADQMEREFWLLDSPMRAAIQRRIRSRMAARNLPETHRMWGFIESELSRSQWMKGQRKYDDLLGEARWFLDFSAGASHWSEGTARMARVRTPLVVLHAADDPVPGTAQAVAELFGRVSNPNCGAIVIGRGGHTGFAAVSAPYYYSLMKTFFDPRTAPATVTPGAREGKAEVAVEGESRDHR